MCWFESSSGHLASFLRGLFYALKCRPDMGYSRTFFLLVSFDLTLFSHFLLPYCTSSCKFLPFFNTLGLSKRSENYERARLEKFKNLYCISTLWYLIS